MLHLSVGGQALIENHNFSISGKTSKILTIKFQTKNSNVHGVVQMFLGRYKRKCIFPELLGNFIYKFIYCTDKEVNLDSRFVVCSESS